MDVKLPDGTLLQDVPEGTTQRQLIDKLYAARNPNWQPMMVQMHQQHPWGSGLPKFANELGGKVTDMLAGHVPPEVAGGAGYASNILTQAAPALLSGFRLGGNAPVSLAERPAKWLMQSAVKPTQADRASGAADSAMRTMLQEDISPTAGGMDKAARLARALNEKAEQAVASSPASVSINNVGQRLQKPAQNALTQVNPQADIDTVKNVWQGFKDSPLVEQQRLLQSQYGPSNMLPSNLPAPLGATAAEDVSIPVRLAHALKKGTYQSIGGKAYGEVGSVSTEAQKALARGLREEVAGAVPEAADALKHEASLMNVQDVARNRVLGEANKNPMGLAALRIGDNPLSAVSFLADRSAYVKGLLSRLLYRGTQPQTLAPAAIAGETAKGQLQQ